MSFRRYLDLGAQMGVDADLRHKIQLTNGFCALLQLALLFFAVVDALRGAFAEVAIDVVVAVVVAMPPLLNGFKRYGTARATLVVIANAGALLDCWVLGSGAGLPYLFVCTATLTCALYDRNEAPSLVAGLALALGGMVVSAQFPENGHIPTDPATRRLLGPLTMGFCVLAMSSIVLHLNSTKTAYARTLAQLSKMAALGRLAAGLAHEVNNPLTVIRGRARQLATGAATDAVDRTLAELVSTSIETNVERIARITKEMLAFAQVPEATSIGVVAAAEVVAGTADTCRTSFGDKGVTIAVDAAAGIDFVGDFTHVQQALIQLVTNARDALDPTGGIITITAGRVGSRVFIDVANFGPGIPDALAERVMEPFFTTKPIGKGTGLGLSLAKGLLEASGGSLHLTRREGPTTFRILLPAATEPQAG